MSQRAAKRNRNRRKNFESIKSPNWRPTFYNYGRKNQPIRAAGILYYRQDLDRSIHFLMQRKYYSDWNEKTPNGCPDHFWEDLGGKTDKYDRHIKDTVARECAEETNFLIRGRSTLPKLDYKKSIYLKGSKYLLFVAESPINYKTQLFGNREDSHGVEQSIPRTIEWVPEKYIYLHKHMHPRLRYRKMQNIMSKMMHKVKFQAALKELAA